MASDSSIVPRRTGGDLLVDVLRHAGTDVAFGVVSVHNLPLVAAVDRDLRWVPTRGEAGAVNAADGWSRATGRVGCAVTSTGTGAGNAAGALVEALTAATPLLHVTGQIEREHLGRGRGVIHETRAQLEMLTATSAMAATVGSEPATDFATALRSAGCHPRGPVSLEWPVDEQFLTDDSFDGLDEIPEPPAPATTSDADIDQAIALLAAANRPLVWAGGGALGCDEALSELLDRLGAGLITSNAGRGALPESDDRVIGNFGSSATGAALLAEADLLLSIGTHFRSNETRSYRLGLPQTHVQIDVDPQAISRAYPASLGLVGDAADIVAALARALHRRPNPAWTDHCRNAREEAQAALHADIGPYGPIADTINDVLPAESPRVRDITIPNSSWGNRLLNITDPRTNIYPRGGGIGQALGLALGASIARPEHPTLTIIGDGGLQVQLGELASLRQESARAVIVVFDDGGYGVLRNMQDHHLDRRSGVDLFTPSIPQLAAAHDMECMRATTPDEFDRSFRNAVGREEPTIIHVDCAELGPMPTPFVPPVHIPEAP